MAQNKVFGIFVIIMMFVISTITIISFSIFSGTFLFIFFMWFGYYQEVHEINSEFKSYGVRKIEFYQVFTSSKKNTIAWYSPHCSILVQGQFYIFCGKKIII